MNKYRTMFTGAPAFAGLLAVGALLAACATQPQRNDQLEQARMAVRGLEQDPDAQHAATEQLNSARGDLERANTAFEKHQPPEQVTYLAYLAQREAETGKARTDEYRAHKQLAQGSEKRNRILLEARNQEVQQAREAAQAQAQQAHAAREQTQATQQRMQMAQKQAQQAQGQLAQERQQLSDLNARETARGLELTLSSDLLFNTGSATIKPGATLQLNRLADFMKGHPRTRIIVEGYTDGRGSVDYNLGLSQQRARAVASTLESQGVPNERIQAIGRGKNYPVASNQTPEGRQQNRRVDIVLSDMAGRFAQSAAQGPVVR